MSEEQHNDSTPQAQQETDVKLFIGNITYKTTDQDLRELFEKYGRVKEARVAGNQKILLNFDGAFVKRGLDAFLSLVDSQTQRPRGFGFITMANKEEAEEAMNQISKTQLDGREIRVEISSGERRQRDNNGRRDFNDRRRDFGDRRRDDRGGRDDRGRDRSRSRDRRDRSRSRDRRDYGGGRGGDRRGDGGYERRGDDRRGDDRRGGDRDNRGGDNYRNREGGRRDSR